MPTFSPCGLPLSLPIRRIHWSCGPRLIVGGAFSRSLSGDTSLGTTTPSAALVRYLLASMVAPAGEALIGGDDLGRGARDRAGGVGGQADRELLVGQRDGERRVVGLRVDELGAVVVAAVLAPRLRAQDDRLGGVGRAEGRRAAVGRLVGQAGLGIDERGERHVGRLLVADHGRRAALIAPGLLRSLDLLGDVRVLGGQVVDALVALLRGVVARVEVVLEVRRVAGRVLRQPLLRGNGVDVAVGRGDLHVGRIRAAVALVADPEDLVVVLVVVRRS